MKTGQAEEATVRADKAKADVMKGLKRMKEVLFRNDSSNVDSAILTDHIVIKK